MTQKRGLGIWLALPMVFLATTRARVADYSSELRIWSDTVLKRPLNARAHLNLGHAFEAAGKLPDAIAQFEVAFRLQPTRPETLSTLASALLAAGRIDEAIGCAIEAVRAAPNFAEAHYTLANAMARAGRLQTASAECEAALRLEPAHAAASALLARLRR
jgi:protein O-mannosyl-transferase